MALLNVNNSIVDYLKSQKQDSSYSARTKLYGSSDLGNRLGDYVGSAQQNTALLNYLKKQSQPEVAQAPDTGAAGAQNYLNEQGSATPNANVINYLTTKYGRTPTTAELTEYFRPKTQEEQTGLPADFMTAEQVYQKQLSEGYFDEEKQSQIRAQQEADKLAQIKSTPEYQLQEEEANAQRKALETSLQQSKETTQKTYESRGIASSGLKAKEISDTEAEASAKQLGIDRGLAKIVLQAIREGQQEEASRAEEELKAQTEALKSAGYTSIGGKLYPTLEREKYETSQNKEQQPELRQVGKSLMYVYPDGTIQLLYQSPEEPELRTVGKSLLRIYSDGRQEIVYTSPDTSSPTSSTGEKYSSRLSEEIDNVYKGIYGTDGAREQAINILQREFPSLDVANDIYRRVPDGYEKNVKADTGTETQKFRDDFDFAVQSVQNGVNKKEALKALIQLYPDKQAAIQESWDIIF